MQTKHNTVRMVSLGILATGLMLAGCTKAKAPAAPMAMPDPEVSVVTLQAERTVLTTRLAGRISANLVAEVRPQVGGIVQERKFVEGSDVKAGDVLYQIDPAMFQAACASAEAAKAKAEAHITPVRLKMERYKELVKINAISQQDYDEAVAALKLAEADLTVSQAVVEIAKINLEYTRVKAPISGRIGKSSVTTGALVTAGQPTALAVIQQLDSVYVDVSQSSANLLLRNRALATGKLKRDGASQACVKLVMEDGTPYPHVGALNFSDVTVDPGTGSFTLRTTFPNPEHALLPGMYVRTIIEEGVVEAAILVPQRAVSHDPRGNATALVVNAAGKVELREIKIPISLGNNWLVEEGLMAGDRVILEGLQRVRPGVAVRVVPFAEKAGPAAKVPAAAAH
jgi:membrane fusion protein (multidrug efflux system)